MWLAADVGIITRSLLLLVPNRRAAITGHAKALEDFQSKFRVADLLIKEFEFWLWSVRPVQCTLGAGVLSLKRYAEKFSETTREEMTELAEVIARLERTLAAAFSYDKINYLMLMMVDPAVHFHVVPRYASARSFAGMDWQDTGWPALPVLAGESASDATLNSIAGELRSHL